MKPTITPRIAGGGYGWDEDPEGLEIEVGGEIKTQADGLRALAALREHAAASGGKFRDIDAAVTDLRAALAAVKEQASESVVGTSEREMCARYVSDTADRKLHLLADEDDPISEPGFLDDEPCTPIQRSIQEWVERRNIMRQFQRISGGRPHTPRADKRIAELSRALPNPLREHFTRAFADASTVGGEWIPDEMLPIIEREIRYEYVVAGLFDEVPVSRETALLPYLTAGFIPYLMGEVSTDDPAQVKSSTMATTQRSYAIKTFGARAQISENAAEDSILPVVDPIIRPELIRALSIGHEDALINADTAATHEDTGLATWNPDSIYPAAPGGGSNDHRRAFIGLRARAFDVSNTTDRGTMTAATSLTDIAKVKGPKQGPGNKVWIASGQAIVKIMGFSEMLTLEKYGPQASISSGEAGRLFGIPVVESQMLTDDLNASGVFDDTTKTKGGMLLVNRGRFKTFMRRGIRLRMQGDITRGIVHLVADCRHTFGTLDGSGTKNVHFAYNVA